ncbi:heavy metal translocating P-type ATPase [Clostridium chauvoei]|uniref:Cadmium-translocating P-type ATPase n=2 Tax=Clostridium chauvoei TaxID=46867 RepID=A0ABD4RHN5_9CLOT|nr:heavy metal translocating P-type ATPase [Clostridium chauvoei]ATD56017.1 cadmium-translocating P-type ATPase [Clostridium chauvoei]ATD56314.1 cadmium-translocating P-type ATPase [Clostridium chauvoei]MBX7280916.1 cadmium-translocating P-type ATPase [Clostridium chauvoei]MBX7283399.1 cadmium-translocating P-type ATPase [Clostridium chauvoei]MBX7285918.1 cadmium-translocating P-type ATPase [Clostridium chauvoei]
MKNSNIIKLTLEGLTCANCGNKIEGRVNKLNGVVEANLNFSTSTLIVEIDSSVPKDKIIEEVKDIVKKLEPEVIVLEKGKSKIKRATNKNICKDFCCDIKEGHHNHNHSHSGNCCNEHHHHEDNKKGGHEHEHNHESISFKLKDNWKLIIGAILYIIAMILSKDSIVAAILFVVSYVLIGGGVVYSAFRNIIRGELFDENFLMTVATLGAFFIGEFPEGVAVMLFYQIGEMFQGYAVNRSRKSITSLMDIRADYANLLVGDKDTKVSPEDVSVDDIIIIKPGERVPLDGVVIEGSSLVDTSALTGESVPREIKVDEQILAGCINNNGVLKVKVTKGFGESTVSRILELVENASSKKAPTEKFITKFSKIYTPIVVFLALGLALIPPLVISNATFDVWIYRASIFLVVSCPCALVISVPLVLFAGIGGASKKGILVKGGNYLEALKDVDTVVFDKTGTITKGVFKVTEVNPINIDSDKLLEIAALGEVFSNHPIAQSIVKAYGKEINKDNIKEYEEVSGHGIKVSIDDEEILLGNYKLMKKFNIQYEEVDSIGTIVYIAINKEYKGNIIISDEIKKEAKEAIKELKENGINRVVMLTGDNKVVAEKVAKSVGIDNVYSELLPVDKVEKIEGLLKEGSNVSKVAFVGDGINDAPVLARADIGVAMGNIGSDAAIEAADIVLMNDEPQALVEAIKVAKKTNKVLWQNIIFALGIKIFVLLLGAFGVATMWEAVFADVGVTILAVLNSTRCLK